MNKFEVASIRVDFLRSIYGSAVSHFCDSVRWDSRLVRTDELTDENRWNDEAVIAALTNEGKEIYKMVGDVENALLKLL